MTEINEIKNEHYSSWRDREMWAIIDLPNGNYAVYCQSSTSVAPMTEYRTKREAVARFLQLIGSGPVRPQTWPERVEVSARDIAP